MRMQFKILAFYENVLELLRRDVLKCYIFHNENRASLQETYKFVDSFDPKRFHFISFSRGTILMKESTRLNDEYFYKKILCLMCSPSYCEDPKPFLEFVLQGLPVDCIPPVSISGAAAAATGKVYYILDSNQINNFNTSVLFEICLPFYVPKKRLYKHKIRRWIDDVNSAASTPKLFLVSQFKYLCQMHAHRRDQQQQ